MLLTLRRHLLWHLVRCQMPSRALHSSARLPRPRCGSQACVSGTFSWKTSWPPRCAKWDCARMEQILGREANLRPLQWSPVTTGPDKRQSKVSSSARHRAGWRIRGARRTQSATSCLEQLEAERDPNAQRHCDRDILSSSRGLMSELVWTPKARTRTTCFKSTMCRVPRCVRTVRRMSSSPWTSLSEVRFNHLPS